MPLEIRPPDLALSLDDELKGVLGIGLLEAANVQAAALPPPEFTAARDRLVQRLIGQHAGKSPSDLPGMAETRALFHALGLDPTKTRPSSEALLRRVLQGKGLPEVNLAVDVCNVVSLERQLPLGLYDREQVHGAVRARLGRPGESYPGIRKKEIHLGGRLLLADDRGPFGAPTSDSLRTAVTGETTRLLVAVFCPLERTERDLAGVLEQLSEMLARHAGAAIVAARTIV
jgi:DNA/RNA-binding domain of Phe-tRNA-synthetase-like protein